jgi:hypothetical protein
MATKKYNLYREKFGTATRKDYVGKIYLNSVSKRITRNTKMSSLLAVLETIVQGWLDSVQQIEKMKNYRVDVDDVTTL